MMASGKVERDAIPIEDRIMQALDDPRWNWRTVDGISRDTGIPHDEVQVSLYRSGRVVVRSPVHDRLGRALFTTRKRYGETHSLIERLLDHYRSTST